jgi:hypothetical protein
MKDILERLIKLRAEAFALRFEIENCVIDGEILGCPLFGAENSIEETIGALLAHEHAAGRISITIPSEVQP